MNNLNSLFKGKMILGYAHNLKLYQERQDNPNIYLKTPYLEMLNFKYPSNNIRLRGIVPPVRLQWKN